MAEQIRAPSPRCGFCSAGRGSSPGRDISVQRHLTTFSPGRDISVQRHLTAFASLHTWVIWVPVRAWMALVIDIF